MKDTMAATLIAEEHLAEWSERSYEELCGLLDDSDRRVVGGKEGLSYNVVSYALPDRADDIRVVVAVDDGGLSAYKPVTVDFIMRPDGTIV